MSIRFTTLKCKRDEANAIQNASKQDSRYGTDWVEFDQARRAISEAGRAAMQAIVDRNNDWHNKWLLASTDEKRAAIETACEESERDFVTIRVELGCA